MGEELKDFKEAYEKDKIEALLAKDTIPDPGEVFWRRLSLRILDRIPREERVPFWQRFSFSRYAWAMGMILMVVGSLWMVRNFRVDRSIPPGPELPGWELSVENVWDIEGQSWDDTDLMAEYSREDMEKILKGLEQHQAKRGVEETHEVS
jgi:hypothetical protein